MEASQQAPQAETGLRAAALGAVPDGSSTTIKSQVAGMFSKFRDSNVAKRAADLIGPILSSTNSPRSAYSGSGDGSVSSPHTLLSPFNSDPVFPASSSLSGKQSATDSIRTGANFSSSSYSGDGSASASLQFEGSLSMSNLSTPPQSHQGSAWSLQQQAQAAAAAPQTQQQQQQVAASQAANQQGAASGAYSSFTAAKKTLNKLFGSGGSSDGSGQGAPGSPGNGNGLIAAFRAIIPKTSNGSSGAWVHTPSIKTLAKFVAGGPANTSGLKASWYS